MSLKLCKLCEFEDFYDTEIRAAIKLVYRHKVDADPLYPDGREHRKAWEMAQAIRAMSLREHKGPTSKILGVAAGREHTIFHLAGNAQVTATDLYKDAHEWSHLATSEMLTAPEKFAKYPYPKENLTVLHMNALQLEFPDNTFDGIFSSSSIEHFGTFDDVETAVKEMCRVLKPGGVLSLSTEYRIDDGDTRDEGVPGTIIFNRLTLGLVVMQAAITAGLRQVEPFDPTVSEATKRTRRHILDFLRPGGDKLFPHIVLEMERYVFTSVHLAFRKV